MSDPNYFEVLNAINVNEHCEKKGKFTYLSWPFAFAELFKLHPTADIEAREWDGIPAVRGPKGWLVCVTVTVGPVKRMQWHPVLDNNNRCILEPDTFQINTSLQRAAVKAIALHGLGLYIYAGEDLPEGAAEEVAQEIVATPAGKPQDGMRMQDFPADRQREIADWTIEIKDCFVAGKVAEAAACWESCNLPREEKIAVWGELDSHTRTSLKKFLGK